MSCIFCKIIEGAIPFCKVYEDEDVLAILDISQVNKGHTLVMPKAHVQDMLSCPKEILAKVMAVASKVGEAQKSVLHADGVNVLTNVGEAAGQTVMHFHVHVIPRFSNAEEGLEIIMKERDTSSIDLPALAKELAKEVK